MARQNIFDNEIFYEGYKKIREREVNANVIFEIPALFSMLPDLNGKTVLDLGCGFGEHCMEYVRRGASKVTGIDISEKMLETAARENSDPKIEYIHMAMEDIGTLKGPYDVVISSLAFHYIEDFPAVVSDVYSLLSRGGTFLFSQESPLGTCFTDRHDRWTRDGDGNKIYANISNYCVETRCDSTWFVEGVQKYHRMYSTIVNTLADAGFRISRMIEPYPTEEILAKYPDYRDNLHKPDFLLIRAEKS